MDQIVAYVTLFLKLLPALIAAGTEVLPLIERAYVIFSTGTPPTDADWQALRAHEAQQTAIIQGEIPSD